MVDQLLLTTQPGWAFATLAELRARSVRDRVGFYHRDSSLVAPAHVAVLDRALLTPEDVCGLVLAVGSTARYDATARLRRLFDPDDFKQRVLQSVSWSQALQAGRQALTRRYSIEVEVWGETALHRHALADLVRQAVRGAFPRWREEASGGLRFVCKADPQAAFLGVQLYSNLANEGPRGAHRAGLDEVAGAHQAASLQGRRHGTLREHLACGLLMLARVGPDDTVLDPFMGTGTILRAAWRRFGVRACVGTEVEVAAFRLAQRAAPGAGSRLINGPFDQLDLGTLPRSVKLVSNLPFGVQFRQVPTGRLLAFFAELAPRIRGAALLMGRDQAREVVDALRLRAKHVLVLGQPAAIVYG